ncbi:MAG TPA: hypothetical protein DDY14_05615 [Chromatiaceae bacterium]|jgi:ferredoxin|nr:MAG: 4Fe-4S binding protein [Thiohalocapsa sp. PB-PSB1]HBG94797.1 hypothetical protein [Chromatiaceae bacterium]
MGVDEGDHSYWWYVVFAGALGLLAAPALRNNDRVNDGNFSARMIRPPGSVEESEFLEPCIKCDQCLNVCPTNVLQPASLEEGGFEALLRSRTPARPI